MSRDRGVSDVVAYTLVFSTIIFMIGTITVGGIGMFTDVRQVTETDTAEETMRAYAETLADHRTEGVPRRGTTIKLQGHSLEKTDSSLNVTIGTTQLDIETGAFVRTTETDTELVYESGAVFRRQDGGVVVVRQPPLQCDSGTARVPLTEVNSTIAFNSMSRVTLRTELAGRQLHYPDTSGNARANADKVIINTSSAEATDGWNEALEDMDGWTKTPGKEDEFRCGPGLDRAVVHETEVNITLVN